MLIDFRKDRTVIPAIKINDCVLERVSSCKLLGLNRGDICLRCTKIALAHESFCYFLIFCFFVVRHAKRLKFSIVIHWFLRVKENFWLDVID